MFRVDYDYVEMTYSQFVSEVPCMDLHRSEVCPTLYHITHFVNQNGINLVTNSKMVVSFLFMIVYPIFAGFQYTVLTCSALHIAVLIHNIIFCVRMSKH